MPFHCVDLLKLIVIVLSWGFSRRIQFHIWLIMIKQSTLIVQIELYLLSRDNKYYSYYSFRTTTNYIDISLELNEIWLADHLRMGDPQKSDSKMVSKT